MKKLLIPFLLIAAAATASAHCGSCGAGEAAHDKAKVECAKACDKADKSCDKAKACDKSAKASDKAAAPAMPCCASKAK